MGANCIRPPTTLHNIIGEPIAKAGIVRVATGAAMIRATTGAAMIRAGFKPTRWCRPHGFPGAAMPHHMVSQLAQA